MNLFLKLMAEATAASAAVSALATFAAYKIDIYKRARQSSRPCENCKCAEKPAPKP